MKDIDNETLIEAADKIIEMLKAGDVGFTMPGEFYVGTSDLKFLINRQLSHPERNQFKDFARIEHLKWSIHQYFRRKETGDLKYLGITDGAVDLLDMFLRGDLCLVPADSYRPKVEEYRAWVVDTLKKWELSVKRSEQRKARIAKKALEAEESTQ